MVAGLSLDGNDEMKILFVLLAIIAAQAGAQQIGQNTSANASGTYTLTAKAQLVVETVVVKDKQGKFISGLGAKDFTITEDGTPQTIRFCEHQDLAAEETPVQPQRRARNRSNCTNNSPGHRSHPRLRKIAVIRIGACSHFTLI